MTNFATQKLQQGNALFVTQGFRREDAGSGL